MIKGLGEAASKGGVLVLVGLSGTGKGTTVDKLKGKLEKAVRDQFETARINCTHFSIQVQVSTLL